MAQQLAKDIDVLKDIEEMIDVTSSNTLGMFQDANHVVDFTVKSENGENVFYVRRNGANLYAGVDGARAASLFYSQIAQIHEDDQKGADPDFASLRELLEARNRHVKESLSQLGHKALSRSLENLTFKSIDSVWHDIFFSAESTEAIIKGANVEKIGPLAALGIGGALGAGAVGALGAPLAVGAEVADAAVDTVLNASENDGLSEQRSFAGYTTRNFDICPNAQTVFRKLSGIATSETRKDILAAMKATDRFLGIEKEVAHKKSADESDVHEMVRAIEETHRLAGEISTALQTDLKQDFAFTSGHLMAVLEHYDGDGEEIQKLEEKVRSLSDGLFYTEHPTSAAPAESPSVEVHDSRKPNLIMRQEESDPGSDSQAIFFFIKNTFEEILFVRRQGLGYWELPGGLLEEGEALKDALRRQVNFLGYKPSSAKIIGSVDMAEGKLTGKMATVSVSGNLNLPDKYEQYAWVGTGSIDRVALTPDYTADELKSMIYPNPEAGNIGLLISSGIIADVSKQRDPTDLGDPFQSVGEVNTPNKLPRSATPEGDAYKYQGVRTTPQGDLSENTKHLRHQAGLGHYEQSRGVLTAGSELRESGHPLRREGDRDPGEPHKEEGTAYLHKFDTQGWDPGHPETINDSRMQPREVSKTKKDKGPSHQELLQRFKDATSKNGVSKAYPFQPNRTEDVQNPISAQRSKKSGIEPASEEALSSAEAGTGTQAFSSGAVIDLPPEMDEATGVQPHASQGAGGEGVQGGGDGSGVMITTERSPIPTAEGEDAASYDSTLRPLKEKDPVKLLKDTVGTYDDHHHSRLEQVNNFEVNLSYLKEGGGGGGAGGGNGGGGSFGGDGGGSGTAMTSDGTHTATYGGGGTPTVYDSSLKPKRGEITKTKEDEEAEEAAGKRHQTHVDTDLEKNADVYGTTEGLSQLPAPDVPELGAIGSKKTANTVERYRPGDSEEQVEVGRDDAAKDTIPSHQKPLGDDVADLVIAEHEDKYKPAEMEQKPEHDLVRRKIIDEDSHRVRTTDPAAEQYTNLSGDIAPQNHFGEALSGVVAGLMAPMMSKSGDDPSNMNHGMMKVLLPDKVEKQNKFMDASETLVVAGWGNYYVVDHEGHRIGLEGMRKALDGFLARPEYANVNIFHSGIQVGQVIPHFTDENGKVWKTEVRPEGLFVVAALRTDLEVARKAMREILKGTLRGFSIAGNAKKKEVKCDHGQCWTEVTDMEMYEVTLCVQPMNQKSYITDILQKPSPTSCPDCYEGVEVEYDSALQVKV